MHSLRLPQDKVMTSAPNEHTPPAGLESEEVLHLRADITGLRDRFSKLSDAFLRISDVLEYDAVLQEAVECACSLTGAKYGVLLTYDSKGEVANVISTGLSPEEIDRVRDQPSGLGLLGYLNEIREPLRIPDISGHPRSVGFPDNHPPMKSFLGMPIRNQGNHLGNIFLTEKEGEQEFSLEDEETLVLFASQAAYALSNARRYEELRRAKADLETLVNISPVGVAVFDARNGKLVSVNQEVRRIVGDVRLPERPWEHLMEILTYRRADGRVLSFTELPLSRVLQSGETVRAEEITIGFPDGRSVTTLVNAAPIYSDSGEIVTVVVALQDMTPVEDLERLRAEFLGMVSEELRTPLTTIRGSTAALLESFKPHDPSESVQLLRIIDQQTDLMRTQINSLIELTRLETGSLTVSPEPLSVSEIVEDSIREFSRNHVGATIVKELPDELALAMVDRHRILQVLQDLYSLGLKNSGDGASIAVSAVLVDIYVAVSVKVENGAIAASSSLPQRRVVARGPEDEAVRPNDEASLAIAVCRGVVEAHGGRLKIESRATGRGTTFTFTLPQAEEAYQVGLHEREEAPLGTTTLGTERAKILVAVADPKASAAIRRHLPSQDYTTVPIFDQAEIDQILARERPHLILLDLPGPEVDLLHLTRRLTDTYALPIIVLSHNDSDASVARALEWGAHDYLVKPFSPTELIARIKACLRKQSVSRRANSPSGYTHGNVRIDYDARTLTVMGTQVQLTATEYKLLFELSNNAGRVLTQDELLHRVWGPEYSGEPQLLRSYVKSVRQKLGDNARNPIYIFTEHGVGYRMARA